MASVSYCLNPKCPNPSDPANSGKSVCIHCGSELLLQGRYRLVAPLGGGGFGRTFEVDDNGARRVLKVLLKEHPKAVELFKQEADVLVRLRHPGIPKVDRDGYFTFTPAHSTESFHCLVMEKIAGANLQDWLKHRGRPISQEQAVNWLKQLSEILDQVHRLNYFHRDIKPHNIMCKPNGQLVLIDFGTAREVSATYFAKVGQGQNVTGIVSPGYTPPEQTNGKAVPQSDFFALGRTFVYLLTGKPPTAFPENPRTGRLMWRKGAPQVSDAVANVIDYLMAPFPGNRPQSPQMVLQCLEEINLDGAESQLPTQLPTTGQTKLRATSGTPEVKKQTSVNRLRPLNSGLKKTEKDVFDWKKKLLAGTAVLMVSIGASQIYGSLRYGVFPANPVWLLSTLPSTQFLQGRLDNVESVNAIALSPDGQTLVSASLGTIRIWNVRTERLRVPPLDLVHSKKLVNTVAVSPDGSILASGGGDKNVILWDLKTGRRMRTIPAHKAAVKAIAFSRDGQILASGSDDKTIRLWNVRTGSRLRTLSGHAGGVNAIALSGDGKTLASGSQDKTVRLWNLGTGEVRRIITGHGGAVNAVAFSPNGKIVASASTDNTIRLSNVQDGKRTRTLKGHSSSVRTIAFSPDSRTLISGGGDIIVWDLKTGKERSTLSGHTQFVSSVAISSRDSKTFVSGSPDRTIKIWRMP
ncbi:protein kinase domain-containing protein [Microcoleus vaginatus]|uniref:protein kinase domain-containing protein n=1 Tax=Microcoleus vaginatus TaxID=119532 RepID=UPI0016890816|nr:serine/threonine protein kinase [Microcoleus sp. FACHB-84]MBD2008769.1 serine/threonine protein kinase [Microcoleus sp. FACHB-45]